MEEKILFPSGTDWKYARLIRRGENYVIQSRYNDETKIFENEVVVNVKDNACPEILAITVYCDTLCNAIGKKLRQRNDYAEWLEKIKIPQEEDNGSEQQI